MRQRFSKAAQIAVLLSLTACGDDESSRPQDQAQAPGVGSEATATDWGRTASSAPSGSGAGADAIANEEQPERSEAVVASTDGATQDSDATQRAKAAINQRARDIIAQVNRYMASGDLVTARGVLDRLQSIEGEVPASVQAEIEQLRERLAPARDDS